MSYNDTPHDEVETFSKITPELFSSQSEAWLSGRNEPGYETDDRSLLLNLRASSHLNENAHKSALWGQMARRDVCSFEQKQPILHEDRKRPFESKNPIATIQPYRVYSL